MKGGALLLRRVVHQGGVSFGIFRLLTHQSFYVIELNFISFTLPESEFLPRTIKISK